MIYYLGEMARRQLDPETGKLGAVYEKEGRAYADYPEKECVDPTPDQSCKYLFVLKKGLPEPGDFVSVFYDGRWYSVPRGTSHDRSSMVIDILRQQMAVNSSAK